jgi:hypothetical protein
MAGAETRVQTDGSDSAARADTGYDEEDVSTITWCLEIRRGQ